jgi:hypothetical protein
MRQRTRRAQSARCSPNGKDLFVTSHEAPLGTIFDAKLETQKLRQLGRDPMDMVYHPDSRIVLIVNHDAGSLAVATWNRPRCCARCRPVSASKLFPSIDTNTLMRTARDANRSLWERALPSQ